LQRECGRHLSSALRTRRLAAQTTCSVSRQTRQTWANCESSLESEMPRKTQANQITGAKVAGACRFMRLVLSRFPSCRSGAYRHFAQFHRSAEHGECIANAATDD
jgi:hypothetical protein